MRPELLLSEAGKFEQKLVSWRRYLHARPEVGFELTETKRFVKEKLTAMGYEPKDCGKSGVVALAGKKSSGKTFLLRADMDALPVQEEADVEFLSLNEGKMHACGHDMHTAMLLGAAKLLKKYESELEGTVKLCFQPAEEALEGAHDMIAAGLLKNPRVDAALMLHVMAGVPFPMGSVIVSSGGVSAPAADYFRIRIQGKGCHGAMPQFGADPITIAAHIVTSLQEIHARELAMTDDCVLTFGLLQAGETENVIPDTAVLGGTLRAYDDELRSFLKKRLTEICTGISRVFRGEAKVTFTGGCPTLMNSGELSEAVAGYCRELMGPQRAFSAAQIAAMPESSKASKTAGSEDFSYISHEVPSTMLALAAGHPENGYLYPQHHPKVKFDEDALVTGSCVYAYTAVRWLEEHK